MTTKRLTCAETAKLVREALRAAFPGTRFYVRSHTYSLGASINVAWMDGPTLAEVYRLTDRYRRSDFDGQTDSRNFRSDTLVGLPGGDVEAVMFGADFIDGTRALSPAYEAQLAVVAEAMLGEPFDRSRWYDEQHTEYGLWGGASGASLLRWLAEHVPQQAQN